MNIRVFKENWRVSIWRGVKWNESDDAEEGEKWIGLAPREGSGFFQVGRYSRSHLE
jgi:hypothetical protein